MPVTGVADLPLHGGHVPPWLAKYMRRLAEALAEAIVELYSPEVLVERLADPIWFQAFNNAIGMDWDSSGSTTVTIGILKQVTWSKPELGVVVLGGKGARSREVPDEAVKAVDLGLLNDRLADGLIKASRLAAKTDNMLLGDGYTLYHHAVIATSKKWCIVQQGLNPELRLARRYHWLSPLSLNNPTLEPPREIAAARKETIIEYDLTSRASLEARRAIVEIAATSPPRQLLKDIILARRLLAGNSTLDRWFTSLGGSSKERHSIAPFRYYRPSTMPPSRQVETALKRLYELKPATIEEMILTKGVGPATLRSLILVAELVYGIPVSHSDPAQKPLDPFRYAYIVGGKDGVPFPFRADYAEHVIEFLKDITREAKLGPKERRQVLSRLERLAKMGQKPSI